MRTPKPWPLPKHPTSWTQLRASGLTEQMLRTALVSGRLMRVRKAVYLDAGLWPEDPLDQHLLRAEAELELFPASVISHESAGAVWGLPHPGFTAWHDHPVSLTHPRGTIRCRTSPVMHRVGLLPTTQVTRDGGGRAVTSIARTAVDLAAGRSVPDALVILDGAARLLCASMVANPRRSDYANPRLIDAVRELLTQASLTRPRAGLTSIIDLTDPRRESAPESLSAGHFWLAGLPAPEYQMMLDSPSGRLYPDFYWAEQTLVGECDGAAKYADAEAVVREKQREQVLRDLGYPMVRWLAKEIMLSPEVVVERVARALGVQPTGPLK